MQEDPPQSNVAGKSNLPPKPKHEHATLTFPEGFLWGAATSAFQVEGNNTNADWWEWENRTEPPEKRSGMACDQYHLFVHDFELAKKLGQNTHRLSIEWSRIEPKEGEFDQTAIEHYKEVLKNLKDHGFVVMLTLWHFTNPTWIAEKGGWLNGKSAWYFERFVKKIVPEVKEYVDLWITLNEPGGYAFDAYGRGKFPPQKKGKLSFLKAYWNLAQAHRKAYRVLHQLIPHSKVGISHNLNSFQQTHKHSLIESIAVYIADLLVNHSFYLLTSKNTHDFIGFSYYYHHRISKNGKFSIPRPRDVFESKKDVSDLGWEIYPPGMYDVLMDFSDYHLPIYITENGVASSNDDRRVRFLISHLQEAYHAIASGVDIKGYFHWSFMDNYEWVEGYAAPFGLIEVDFKTQKRTPRPSALVYQEIIKNNGIPHRLLKLLGHGLDVEEEMKGWPNGS